jgi:hypothetical protein
MMRVSLFISCPDNPTPISHQHLFALIILEIVDASAICGKGQIINRLSTHIILKLFHTYTVPDYITFFTGCSDLSV